MEFKNITLAAVIATLLAALLAFHVVHRRLREDAQTMQLFETERLRARFLAYFHPGTRAMRIVLLALGLLTAAFVLWDPAWGQREGLIVRENLDLLFVIDVSRSMDVRDVEPSRLERAKLAAALLAREMAGARLGILAFAAQAFYYCPFTSDQAGFQEFLDALGPEVVPNQGTEIEDVFSRAERIFKGDSASAKLAVVITDGEIHGRIPDRRFVDATGEPIKAFVLGVGTTQGGQVTFQGGDFDRREKTLMDNDAPVISRLDEAKLKRLAANIGGEYHDISRDFSGLDAVRRGLRGAKIELTGNKSVKESRSRAHAFVIIPLLLWAAAAALGMQRKEAAS